jgi:hypothetical protein
MAVGAWARGTLSSDSVAFSIAERWDGLSWAILPTPRLPGGMSAELFAVACPDAKLCVAVGAEGAHEAGLSEPSPLAGDASPLVEQWNGKSWSVMASPQVLGASLDAVACPSALECIAVGWPGTEGGRPLAERWDGHRWSLMSTPDVAGGELSAIACPAVDQCLAVGSVPFAGQNFALRRTDNVTLPMGWDGQRWVAQQTPRLPQSGPGAWRYQLAGLACSSTASCFAVGYFSYAAAPPLLTPLVEGFDGKVWTVRSFPGGVAPAEASLSAGSHHEPQLLDVSCSSASACTAVGSVSDLCVPHANPSPCTLEASWNGTSWRIEPSTLQKASLSAVACVSECVSDGTAPLSEAALPARSRINLDPRNQFSSAPATPMGTPPSRLDRRWKCKAALRAAPADCRQIPTPS